MKKSVAATLIVASALTVAAPAGAAVPKTKQSTSVVCPDEPGKSARVWIKIGRSGYPTKFAVDNPCKAFLAFAAGSYASGAAEDTLLVAPGAHFNWGKKRINMYIQGLSFDGSSYWERTAECQGSTTVRIVYRYDDVRRPDC